MPESDRHAATYLLGRGGPRGGVAAGQISGFRVKRGWMLIRASLHGPGRAAYMIDGVDRTVFVLHSRDSYTGATNVPPDVIVKDDCTYVYISPERPMQAPMVATFVFRDEIGAEHVRHA